LSELSVQAVLRSRRLWRAGWVLTLGVALALGLWAERPSGGASACVVVMATLATPAVWMSRQREQPALGPFVGGVATAAVGGGLVLLGAPGSAGALVAVGLFAMAAPTLGGLGPTGGAALGIAMVAGALLRAGEASSPALAVSLAAGVAAGLAAGLQLARRERADLADRAEQAEVAWTLARRAQTDALTRLPNRLSIQAWLDDTFADTLDNGSWLSVLVVDIDHFKRVNDTWGHPTGDRVLAEVARVIQSVLRRGDVAGRWGGEEFLVVLGNCAPVSLASIAERLRRAVEALQLTADDGTPIRLTVSIGGASLSGGDETTTALLGRADEALYRAKQAGRNRVDLVAADA